MDSQQQEDLRGAQPDSPERDQPVPAQQEQMEYQDQNEQDYGDQQYADYGPEAADYGDEGGEVSGALKATRVNKKKAADDARLLANRIALLKMEERKAWKKIAETKRKADQVWNARQRNEEDRARKDALRQAREREDALRAQQNAEARAGATRAIRQQAELTHLKHATEAQRLKEESERNAMVIKRQRDQEAAKNHSIKEMIRRQKMDAEERKALEEQDKRQAARNRLINSILEENSKRMEIEGKVADLEKEEYDLIQRLQNTSNIQKQAYEDLESALNGQISPDQLEAQFGLNQSTSKNGSKMAGRGASRGQAR